MNELDDETLDLDKLIGSQLLLFADMNIHKALPKRILVISIFLFCLFHNFYRFVHSSFDLISFFF